MADHLIGNGPDEMAWCSCGRSFPDTTRALDHALPRTTRALADAVRADPESPPDLLERAEITALDASLLPGDDGATPYSDKVTVAISVDMPGWKRNIEAVWPVADEPEPHPVMVARMLRMWADGVEAGDDR